MADKPPPEPDDKAWMKTVILTWVCQHCGWANDNTSGPCRKCGKESKR